MTAGLLLAAALAPAPPMSSLEPPCSGCITWEVGGARAAWLAEREGDLHGLHILLQESLQEPIPDDVRRRLRERGADLVAALEEGGSAEGVTGEAVLIRLDPTASATAEARAFTIASLATRLRARDPRLRVGLDGPRDLVEGLLARGLAAYVDFVATDGARPASFTGEAWSRRRMASEGDLVTALQAGGPVLAPWPDAEGLVEAPLALAALDGVLHVSLAPLPALAVACTAGAATSTSACDAPAFLAPDGALVVLVTPRQPVRALRVGAAATAPGELGARLLPLVRPAPALALDATAEGGAVRFELPAQDAPFVLQVDGWGAQAGVFGSGVEVVAGRGLTVEEVVARHQAQAARQRRLAPSSIASGTLVIAFQAPGLTAPLTVTADVVLYDGPAGSEIEQRGLRFDGVSLQGDAVPRLPIVEPERVAVPPLALVLGSAYRYALRGTERVGTRLCYRVAFDTPPGVRPGLHGQAWIEAEGFGLVRLQAVETGLRGPIVSSEQTDEFAPLSVGGATVWLLARSTVHQAYEGPGFRTAIDRVFEIRAQEASPPDFARRLAAAHASTAVMLRETAHGYEYLKKAPPSASRPEGSAARVPAGKATAVRTVALGLVVDPNIGDPLPFAGGGYSDFDFLHTGTQLNVFLAGAFAQLSWQAPSLFGSRWRAQVSGQASLVTYNDRVFRRGVEQYGENLRQRPARAALELSRPLGARWRARAGYDLEYTRLRGSDLTAADFALPDSHLAHGLRLALDGQQGPWSLSAWFRPAWRPRWKAWGLPGDPEGRVPRDAYQRFGATLGRTLIASPGVLGRMELSAFGGSGLDRFSRYAFDGIESRLAGYPVASVRFDRGLVGHGLVSWRVRPGLRLQALVDAARVRDAGFGDGSRTLVGLGAGLEAALPWRALLAVDWGYGPSGTSRDGRRGTQTLRLTAFRVF